MNQIFAEEARVALTTTTARQRALMRRGAKIRLAKEQRAGWKGKLPFYLFWCAACKNFTKDYPHGHIERQYLSCSHCGAYHSFIPWWAEFAALFQRLRTKDKRG